MDREKERLIRDDARRERLKELHAKLESAIFAMEEIAGDNDPIFTTATSDVWGRFMDLMKSGNLDMIGRNKALLQEASLHRDNPKLLAEFMRLMVFPPS